MNIFQYMQEPVFVIFCIDKRFGALSTDYLKEKYGDNYYTNYFFSTTAGASLSLAYDKYTKKCCCSTTCAKKNTMDTLKESLLENLTIAQTLYPVNTVYIINHQDCGAMRAYLDCSHKCPKYPNQDSVYTKKEKNNEININEKLLKYAYRYVKKSNSQIKNVLLGLMDINGTVYNYDINEDKWYFEYQGPYSNPNGLWIDY